LETERPALVTLFLAFLRLGVTAFGGSAMVAYIRKLTVADRQWLNSADFQEGVAFCQVVPGATATQTAAYVGLKVRGVAGAAVSFIGFILPAFFLMTILSVFYSRAHNLPFVLSAFNGLRVVIVAVVANAALSFGQTSLKSVRGWMIAAVAALLFGVSTNPALVLGLSALLGLLLFRRNEYPGKEMDPGDPIHFPWTLLSIVIIAFCISLILRLMNPNLFDLTMLMIKVDLLAFGGGYASVPLMYHEIVEAHGWMKAATFMDGIVLGQITPGPIVITATFAGYWLQGFIGGVWSTLAVFFPSFLIVIGLAPYYGRLRQSHHFNRAMAGILISFVGLLIAVTVRFALEIPWDLMRMLVVFFAMVALIRKVDIFWVVIAGTIVSLLFF
jgi:chromate transporter